MKAVVLRNFGGIEQLNLEEEDMPPLGSKEVRVRLHATSINPVDWKIRSGLAKDRFPLDLPEILGVDVAGEVDEAAADVTGFPKGMRVMAKANGTYAQYTVVKADALAPIPDNLSYEQAAALPLILLTGAQLIERAAKVHRGQTVLITGALGSVGRVAVHVARQRGARVLAGVRASQREEAGRMAVDAVVGLDDEQDLSRHHDLDAVADTVGGPVQGRVIKLLKDGGTYASTIGPPKETPGRSIKVEAFMAQPDASRLYTLAGEVARGQLIIPIAATYPLEEIQAATRKAEQGGAGGKIVLKVA
jgi:NADPH:quinone reductase-like Zn-dependent oxidoreductase